MLQRILTGVVSFILFLPILFFSHTIVFSIAVAFLSCVGTYELLKCCGIIKKYAISIPSLLFSAAVPMMFSHISREAIMISLIVYLFILLYASVFARMEYRTNDIALAFFCTLFVTISFSSILVTRIIRGGEHIYLLIFIGAWITDTFAYFTGKLFGKHRFIPQISPNKTLEGSIGGVIFCMIAFCVYGFILSFFIVKNSDITPNYFLLAAAGFFTSIVAQVGDLSASAIKRNYNIKDFGTVFPGHGGVLDRFDSVMAVAPIIMIITSVLTKFQEYGLFT